MKKTALTLSLIFALTTLFIAKAQVVKFEDAKNIASKTFSELLSKDTKSINILEEYYVKETSSGPVAYIFKEVDGGFVIISGEQKTIPILAYSDNSDITFNESDWSPAFLEWMEAYYLQIDYIRENDISATLEAIALRNKLANGIDLGLRPAKDVSPLLSTTWSQGCGYNADCPTDAAGPCGRVYTGCVATAMAQVIRYMEYPTNGIGNKCYTHWVYGEQCADFAAATYDYASMTNGSGNAEVAELMYHCGVAVNMNYSPTGSGSYSFRVPQSFKNYFDYKNSILISKNSYDDATWNKILINEIDNSRPMYYSGSGSGGHAFVVDGYQGTDFFHFNWGWGGSHNGYFYLNDLTPGGSNYTNSQQAVIGTIPSSSFTNLDFSGAVNLSCATPISQDLSTGNDYINYYGNTYPTSPGKELVYTFTTSLPGRIRIKTTNISEGNLRIFLLSHPHQDSLIINATNDLIIDDTDAGTYYLAIESVNALEPTFDIEVICPTIDADLIFTNAQVNPDYLTSLQTNVAFSSTIKNIGNTTAAANTITYYISDDMVYNSGTDTYLGEDIIPELTPGASTNIQTTLSMPASLTPGNKHVVFVADESNIVPETDDQNEYFTWTEVPEPGLLDCSASVSLTDGVWYYDNTELNGTNNVESHWTASDQTAPEIIHSFIAPYSGMAKISFTEKIPGKMHCMVYPICNENTWTASIWFSNIIDTLATESFYVNAGMEYYVVVDSKLPTQGEYGVKIDLPQECPNLVLNYWGELELCDGDFFPSFGTSWGYISYQWYKDNIALPNETWSNYNPTQPGSYFVVVEENGCTAHSDTLTVSMSFPPDTATIISLGATEFCHGGNVNLQLDNSVAYPLQWAKDGELIPGETNNLLTVNTAGNYSILTTNGSCTVESDTIIEVIVNNNPIDINDTTPLPSDSIKFFFTFDEDSYDIINNYNFACWDFVPADDRHGNFWQARDFSTGDYYGYASIYDEIPDEFTLSLWFKTTTPDGGMIASFANTPHNPTNQDAVLYMSDDGKLNFYMSNGGTPQELSSVNSYNDGNWHHVLIAHDIGIFMEIDHNVEFINIASQVTHSTFDGYWIFAGPSLPTNVANMPSSQYYGGLLDDIMVINESKYMIRDYIDNTPKLNIYITSGDSVLCDNGLAYFTLENSEFGIEYKVWNNTTSSFYPITEIGTGGDISLGGEMINANTEFMFLATNLNTGCETWLDTTINIYVFPSLTPTISISSDAVNPICEGTMINFSASFHNVGLLPQIDWYYNDVMQGTHTETFSFDGFTDTDTVFAVVHSNYYCPSTDTSISNLNIHTVYPVTNPEVVITSSESGIACEETLITFTALATNCGASPSYQWYRESSEVGTDSNTYAACDFANSEEIYVIVSSDYACSSVPNAESNHLTTNISTIPEADITILSGGYCSGEEICFIYSGETENLDYVEWIILEGGAGVPVATFLGEGPHCFTPTNNMIDIIAEAYNPESCYDTAWIHIPALENSTTPSVTISTDETATYCQSYSEVTFTATQVNSGTNPTYQWYVNGNPSGTNSNIFSSYSLNNNDEIYCIVTNTVACATSNNAESNHININIEQTPIITINTTGGICSNEEICVTYDGSMVNVASINWIVRENTIDTHSFLDAGPHCFMPTHENIEVVITVTGTNTCYDTLAQFFTINNIPVLTIPDTIYKCEDNWVNITEATGYTSYNWSNGGSENSIAVLNPNTYYLTITNEHGCNATDSVAVINYPDEDIMLISDTVICLSETIILSIENEFTYDNIFWSDGAETNWNDANPEIGYMGNNPQFIYVEAQSENCTFSDTIYIHFDICSNIEDFASGIIRIYPNPANEQITISSDEAIGEIKIYDITGKVVYQTYTNNNKIKLDIDNWAKTTYFLQIINKKGESFKSGFVKI